MDKFIVHAGTRARKSQTAPETEPDAPAEALATLPRWSECPETWASVLDAATRAGEVDAGDESEPRHVSRHLTR